MNPKYKGLETQKIIEMKKQGISIKDIALKFDIDYRTIHYHLNKQKRIHKLCGCGCGRMTLSRRFIRGHSGGKIRRENPLVYCACGCGDKFHKYDKWNRNPARKFIHGHNYSGCRSVQGYFYSIKNGKNIFYRSSFELASYMMLEQMDKVIFYNNKPHYVEYEYEGKIKKYFPDIHIFYNDGTSEIIEVKPHKLISYKKNEAKFNSIRNKINNFLIWTELNFGAFLNKSANSVKPKAIAMAIPNQAEEISACVETNVQTSKEMI